LGGGIFWVKDSEKGNAPFSGRKGPVESEGGQIQEKKKKATKLKMTGGEQLVRPHRTASHKPMPAADINWRGRSRKTGRNAERQGQDRGTKRNPSLDIFRRLLSGS